jgi:predicted O-methyltransferase YrrM
MRHQVPVALGRFMKRLKARSRNRQAGVLPPPSSFERKLRTLDAGESDTIRLCHDEYTRSVSSAVAAISLETAHAIASLLPNLKPRLAFDLGSGFSSYVLRGYEKQAAAHGVPCEVISCDDDPLWLARTGEYLKSKGLSTTGLRLWDGFVSEAGDVGPDFILHDLGSNPNTRVATLPGVLDLCRPGTVLVLDDVHKPVIRQAVLGAVTERGLRCFDISGVTYDRFGRYSWVILF